MTAKFMNPDKVWFISDTHFGHRPIIELCKRPFWNLDDMKAFLIREWNKMVQPNDDVFHLGDFTFEKPDVYRETVKALNGRIHLIAGNHDKNIRKKHPELFWSVQDVLEIDVADKDRSKGYQRIFMSHFAHLTWNKSGYGSWNLHGHSHGTLPDDPHSLRMDVGVDATKTYTPISYDTVKYHMMGKTFKPVDHHGEY